MAEVINVDLVAIITAVTGLITAVGALITAIKGQKAVTANMAAHNQRLNDLEKGAYGAAYKPIS